MQHELEIDSEENREEGRAILRVVMQEDDMSEDEESDDQEDDFDESEFEGHQADLKLYGPTAWLDRKSLSQFVAVHDL
jgi:hypothetical protein